MSLSTFSRSSRRAFATDDSKSESLFPSVSIIPARSAFRCMTCPKRRVVPRHIPSSSSPRSTQCTETWRTTSPHAAAYTCCTCAQWSSSRFAASRPSAASTSWLVMRSAGMPALLRKDQCGADAASAASLCRSHWSRWYTSLRPAGMRDRVVAPNGRSAGAAVPSDAGKNHSSAAPDALLLLCCTFLLGAAPSPPPPLPPTSAPESGCSVEKTISAAFASTTSALKSRCGGSFRFERLDRGSRIEASSA
mmetsp:Transcript_21955/g.70940  ORF Transcript_21955/g.70940 Transcript_21955/m.70940 type:complete len:249 (-) Transcript_21955:2975-3721(-)